MPLLPESDLQKIVRNVHSVRNAHDLYPSERASRTAALENGPHLGAGFCSLHQERKIAQLIHRE
jgi:hypothetical protein